MESKRLQRLDSLFYPLIEMESFNDQLMEKLGEKFHRLESSLPGIEQQYIELCEEMDKIGIEERAFFLIQLTQFYLTYMKKNSKQITRLKEQIDKHSKFGRLLYSYVDQFPEEFIHV